MTILTARINMVGGGDGGERKGGLEIRGEKMRASSDVDRRQKLQKSSEHDLLSRKQIFSG